MEELIQLDKQLLLWFNGSDSLFLDGLVKTLTTATTWIPLYLGLFYLVLKNNDNVQKVLLVLGCAGLCVFLAGSLNDLFVKPWVARWRPSRDPEIAMLVDVVNGYRGGRYGFFSSHAANTFSLAIFFTLLVRSKVLSVAMILWSLLNCWTRLYLGVHFPGDILVGLTWGLIVGTSVYYFFYRVTRKMAASRHFISTKYTSTGYERSDCDIPVAVLVFTLLYALIKSCIL